VKILVTGSSGHLGEALMRVLRDRKMNAVGIDLLPAPYTNFVGSITDKSFVGKYMQGTTHVLHTATLHKPHIVSHGRQLFIDTNITGTLNLLEAAVKEGVSSFVFTSTTSSFGDALVPAPGAPAAWITEETIPIPKNIYGVTKVAAEDLCQIFHRDQQLPCLVLRTSRFFPEEDDDRNISGNYADENLKVNEFLYRRADIEDVVSAHLLAMDKAPSIGFDRYIISATTPFRKNDLSDLRADAHRIVKRIYPEFESIYAGKGWKIFSSIGRVYVNRKAREELSWSPVYDFGHILNKIKSGMDIRSDLAITIGSKGYHR
jgi:UDP-glucose 4-epimerase